MGVMGFIFFVCLMASFYDAFILPNRPELESECNMSDLLDTYNFSFCSKLFSMLFILHDHR